MFIKKKPTSIEIIFSPEDYFLRKNKLNPDALGEYCLTRRISMDYCGKPDQEGVVVLYLDDEEAQIFREAGFGEIEGGDDPTELNN